MIITAKYLRDFQESMHISLNAELCKYLLLQYGKEMFPYQLDEEALYYCVMCDIKAYRENRLDLSVLSMTPFERLSVEYDQLKSAYIDLLQDYHALLAENERLRCGYHSDNPDLVNHTDHTNHTGYTDYTIVGESISDV